MTGKMKDLFIKNHNDRPLREAIVFKLIDNRWHPVAQCPSCILCGNAIGSFKDQISIKEYMISGTCQSCQDSVFEGDDLE